MRSIRSPASSYSEEAGTENPREVRHLVRILMILIPQIDARGSKSNPAIRFERAMGPYYAFLDANAEVVLATPDGGSPLMEVSDADDASIVVAQRFKRDRLALDAFSDTLSMDQVCTDDFDAGFCVGIPGPIWHPEHKRSAGALISELLDAGKPVAVMPSGIDLAPKGAGEGVLIFGDSSKSSVPAAKALMGAVRQLQNTPERNVP
jgi:hypothetical protein